jgi:hypothetical protein
MNKNMKKTIANFTIKADVNSSLIVVYKDGELVKGITCNSNELEDKFEEIIKSVVKHVENC